MTLSDEHINYIIKDITYRGIVDDDLGDELVDHICTIVESKMEAGQRFIEAYDETIKDFGNDKKLNKLQKNTIEFSNNNTKIMIKNYFKIAFRNLVKHKFYSAINIAGLAAGVACSLLIYLFVANEMSYDKFHKDGDRIYRVVREGRFGENEFSYPVSPAPFANGLMTEIPEVETAVRFRSYGTWLVKTPEMKESFKESQVHYTDSTFFDLFSFPVLEGDPKTALTRPNTIAISKSIAEKYFKGTSPIGKSLELDGEDLYEVTAVYQDAPKNSHLQFRMLISLATRPDAQNEQWLSNNFFTYFRVKEGVNLSALQKKIQSFYERKAEPELIQYIGSTMEQFKANGNYVKLRLQPMEDIYLTSNFIFDIGTMGNEHTILLFTIIAAFIIGLACINFMNLSTARSANRSKEVGIRKALGSVRGHLIRQFLLESIIISIISIIIGCVAASVLLPLFNHLAEKQLTFPGSPIFYIGIFLFALLIGVLAGVYPAFFLSSFRPINTLKGKLSTGAGGSAIRSGLVIFQFFISIILIIGTLAIQKQLDFIQNKKLGFNKDHLLMINDPYMLGDKRQSFKEEVEKLTPVVSCAYSGFIPVNGYNRNDNTYWEKGVSPSQDNTISLQMWDVDEDYIQTFGMEIIEGRNFDRDRASDSVALIFNEEAMRKFGFEKIDDQWIQTYAFDQTSGSVINDEFVNYKIIGVVENFHFESMKENIGPVALRMGRSTGVLSVRINTDDYQASLKMIEDKWNDFANGLPFNYTFLDDQFNKMYKSETKLGELFTIFSGLAIFIGCLGLFALAAFMAEQRIKEIGIRKVLGASVNEIVLMLSKQFTKLVLLAFILAVPISWWAINSWLDGYVYRITLGFEVFLIAGLSAIIVALITVGYQSIKAAISNPVDSLKNE
ncbi:ABC transporter permease [Fulvivirga lutimaris]|uniref:ABC transporter permease n=1 Tax=Fulvivirga lutimaris TaxID=1819566 RepID=UPI0012BCCCBA|nr:ABC transporter permease [Fulvivirga lutimaris]MTI41046.1 ABC transporter permease [Fulvivirga lutimaris]